MAQANFFKKLIFEDGGAQIVISNLPLIFLQFVYQYPGLLERLKITKVFNSKQNKFQNRDKSKNKVSILEKLFTYYFFHKNNVLSVRRQNFPASLITSQFSFGDRKVQQACYPDVFEFRICIWPNAYFFTILEERIQLTKQKIKNYLILLQIYFDKKYFVQSGSCHNSGSCQNSILELLTKIFYELQDQVVNSFQVCIKLVTLRYST